MNEVNTGRNKLFPKFRGRGLLILGSLFLALLQGAFLPLNLVLLLVIAWTALAAIEGVISEKTIKDCLLVAFISGLILDLASGTNLGLSSLFFLIFVYLELLYSRRFNPLHPAFLPLFVFISAFSWSWLVYRVWLWQSSLILAILGLVIRHLSVWLFGLADRQKVNYP